MPTTIRRWALVVFVAALVFAWRAETNQDVAVAQARKPIMMTRIFTGPDGLSHQEIAEVMNCSVGTVRSRLHYAKQLLQAELQPYMRR